jgi:P27 family predicted phage terminase small subunit
MPGRNPKLIGEIEADNSRTRYTKAEIEARKLNTPVVSKTKMAPPIWMNELARKEWRRIIRIAQSSEVYTSLDTNALAMYCQSYSRLREAYTEYKKLQSRIGEEKTALITSKGQINPLIRLMQMEEEQCRKWGAILGLDPTGRARIGIARSKKEQADPMQQLLDEVQEFMDGQ